MFWNNKNYVNNLNKILYTCKNKPFIFFRYIGLVYEKISILMVSKLLVFSEMSIYTCFIVCIILKKTKYLPKILTERISLHLIMKNERTLSET